MKNKYQWLTVAILFLLHFGASAQQAWRPFRPGLIYTFVTAPVGNATPNAFLLRLDSAYRSATGDSVWAFNRLLRPGDGSVLAAYNSLSVRKSRNNLFGARLT